ncbi:MAG: hypothetical protein ACE5HI_16645, partial [bacterium]
HNIVQKELGNKDSKTISDIWFFSFKSKSIALLISLITITSFLTILFVEIYIGSVLLTYYFPEDFKYGGLISFTLISVFIVGYVRLGGLKAVMQTDQWQMRILIASVFALLFASLFIPTTNNVTFIFSSLFHFSSNWSSILFFWMWILALNISLPWGQLSSWQRISSAKSDDEVWRGLKNNIINFLIVWMIPVIGFIILVAKGYKLNDLPTFFDILKSVPGLISEVFYPLIVVGFASALFSTADTAVVALGTSFVDKNALGDYLSTKSERLVKSLLTVFSVVILLMIGILFFLAKVNIGEWFMPLIYNIFGQLAIVAPLCFYALKVTNDRPLTLSTKGVVIIFLGLLLSWFLIIYSTFLNKLYSSTHYSEFATIFGIIISYLCLRLGLKLSKTQSE